MIIKTEDGHIFYVLEDGRVTDSHDENWHDMSWDNLQDFIESQGLPLTITFHNWVHPNEDKLHEGFITDEDEKPYTGLPWFG